MARKVVFLILPGSHLMDLSGPVQVFYEASQLGGQSYQLIYASLSPSVQTAQALNFAKLLVIEDLDLNTGDLLCIPGIDYQYFLAGKLDQAISEAKPWVHRQYAKGAFVASICSGALILAQMHLLRHRSCTTHWKCLDYLQQHFAHTKVARNRLYCFDQRICTSAGMTAGIDMSLALVERWDSPLVAARVAKEMVINIRRPELVDQENIYLDYRNHFNPDVYRAQEMLSNNLQTNFTVADLAREIHMSPRHLSRLFKDHTGNTIQAYRDKVRIKLGEKLLLHTEKSIKEIASDCGFRNTRQFTRLWNQHKDVAPTAFRTKEHNRTFKNQN